MKSKILFASILAAASIIFTTGCRTDSGGAPHQPFMQSDTNGVVYVFGSEVQPAQVHDITKLAAVAGATAAIKYDTNSIAYLQAAGAVFNAALNSGEYNPDLMTIGLNGIPGANDPNIVNGVNLALASYQAIFSATVEQKIQNQNIYLIPALTGLRDGIVQVVGTPHGAP